MWSIRLNHPFSAGIRTGRSAWPGVRPLLWLLYFLSSTALAQGLDARLDRTRIADGETVTLQISAAGDAQGAPDLSPLDADFDIVDQGQSSQVNIINGRMSSTHEWRIGLLPKRVGDLTIPALHVGSLTSQPLHLTVAPAADRAGDDTGQPVLVEVDADPENPWVQSQVTYKVRVLSQAPLQAASLTEPQAGDAIVQRLGDDRRYETQRHGETYDVIERSYAIFPQHSGKLQIEGPVLTTNVPVQGRPGQGSRGRLFGGDPFGDIRRFFGRDPFAGLPDVGGLFEETRPLRLRGRSLAFDVRPQPAAAKGAWLPARDVTLTESWSPDPATFRVGEPVTRTITLTTKGLSEAQLPSLTPPVPAGLKRYPDQPVTETHVDGDDMIVTRTFKEALVPTASGAMTLPEFNLPWWDTQTRQTRIATLAAERIQVLPPAGASASAAQPAPAAAAEPPVAPNQVPGAGAPLSTPPAVSASTHYWPWVAALAASGWLVTLLVWWRTRRRARRGAPASDTGGAAAGSARPVSPAQIEARIRRACLANDAAGARRALLDWAAQRWPGHAPRGLSELAERLATNEARPVLAALDRVLYDSNAHRAWDGRAAWSVLECAFRSAAVDRRVRQSDALPGLYPQ